MAEIVKETPHKRLVIIGDSSTGKSMIVTGFIETYPGKKPVSVKGRSNSVTENEKSNQTEVS